MIQNEKISVIIPVYNTDKYLEKSVRSVMNQTYRNLDIICVNDGSTDSSAEILERLAAEDDRIRIINRPNSGPGASRNAGIEASQSEWITFLDSDDMVVPDAYETVSKAFAENVDMVRFSIRLVTENGDGVPVSTSDYYTVHGDGVQPVTDDMVIKADSSVCNKFFRRSLIESCNIRFENIYYEDFQFSRQYFLVAQKMYCISRPLYLYIRHEGSIMSNTFSGTKRAIDHLHAYMAIEDFALRNGLKQKFERLSPELFLPCYWLAVRWTTADVRSEVIRLAESIYSRSEALQSSIDRYIRHGTLTFEKKDRHHLVTRILEFIFAIKYETYDYVPHKVVVLFGVTICKWRLKN